VSSPYTELVLTALAAMLSPTTLTFTVFALVLGERPFRTGAWFFIGAFGATMLIGVLAAFVLGNAAAPSSSSETPPTWVAILDIVFAVLLLAWVVRALRRPPNPQRTADAVEKMSNVASSPAVAILAAGATLANPGGFIPVALKSISQSDPSSGEFIVLWTAFALVSLLPLLVALVALLIAPERTTAVLSRVRVWLERNARALAAAIIVLLAAALLRNGIVALT
jgi:hypothetical protein